MAEEDNSVNIKVDENKTQEVVDDGKTNGENEDNVDAKSPVKQTPVKQPPPAEEPESETTQSPTKKQNKEEVNEEAVVEEEEDEDEESESDEELPLGSLEGPVQILEGKRERKKVDRLSLEKKEAPEKKKFEIVEGLGTKLGDMERVEMILGKTNADQLKLLYRFLFGKVGKLFEIKKHIRQFSGFNFTEEDSDFDKKEQFLIRLTMTGLKDICSYLDLERGGNKEVVMKRIMDFGLNPVASGRKVPVKKKKAQKRKRASSGKDQSEKKTKKPKKEKPAKVSKPIDDGDLSDVSSISSISSDSEDEEKKPEVTKSKPAKITKKVESKHESEEEAMEEVKSPKKKKPKETPKKPSTPKKKEKVEKKKKEEKKKSQKKSESPKKSQTPKKSESPKKAKKVKKDYVVSSDSDSSDSEPILKKKKAPSDSELKTTIETLLENANLEEITMKAFCKQVYAQYPDFDLKHKKEFIKTTVKTIVS